MLYVENFSQNRTSSSSTALRVDFPKPLYWSIQISCKRVIILQEALSKCPMLGAPAVEVSRPAEEVVGCMHLRQFRTLAVQNKKLTLP